MRQEDFVKGTEKYGDFYLYYLKADGKTTYLVGTTNLNSPYIREHMSRGLDAVDSGYIRVWSWTSNKLRVFKISKILSIRSLAKELLKCQKRRLRQTKT